MKNFTSAYCKKPYWVLLLFFAASFSFSQNNYRVQIQEQSIEIPENISTFQWNQMPDSSKIEDGYIGWVQFYETPTQDIQDLFKTQNLQLLEYIPNKTYLFYFPNNVSISFLKNNGVRAIVPVEGDFKLSSDLRNNIIPNWAKQGNTIIVTLQFHNFVSPEFVISDLAKQQIVVKQQYKGSNNIDLLIPDNCLEELSNLPYVKWVELIVAPDTPDDTRGRSLHRSNGLDTQTGAGRNYTGNGIGVMVRDDGIVGPHIDFQGRIDNSAASGTGATHGDGVAGIMAGAGNLNPKMRGMAAGADVYVVNYVSNFLDSATQNLINSGTAQITNSSYSNGCNDGYTTITQTVDNQTLTIPTLLHVFSGGNSNGNNCGYGAGSQWGNITGGHKQGKNVIATANVYFDGSLVGSSSRGPAHDGRIKPDIAANGQNQNSTTENNGYQNFGGTSAAAPGIAGISAQLYQAYAEANGGTLPPSALIKATLLNTANDAGNVGPDFKFGWGIVNGLRAGILIEDGRYLSDNVSQGNTNSHTIAVPAGTTQVRFMLYWSDVAASPGANPALVNDLDLVVTDPASTTHLPWVLDSTPNATALNTPATNGADHLNNMEQVLINNPVAGNYTLDVSGFNVPVGPQDYFIVYEFITENITVTYPNSGEHFVPNETESIHWDAVNTTDNFLVEYSTDNGSSWNTIATVGSNTFTTAWVVPNTVSGEALIRVTSGAFSDVSDDTFSIAGQPSNLEIAQLCPNTVTFSWDAVANAESYDMYLLGNKYMEVVGNATTNTITLPITNPNDSFWYAIVAKNDTDSWESRRTIAQFHPGGLVNCVLSDDVSLEAINNTPGDFNTVCNSDPIIISVTIRNTGINAQSNFPVTYQLNAEPPVTEMFTASLPSGQQMVFDFSTPANITTSGAYTLTTSVNLAGDENSSNDQQVLNFYAITSATALNFEETFETNGFPPPSWFISNPDDATTWIERTGVTGSDGSPTTTSYINNFNYNSAGQEDSFITEIFNLTNATVPSLTFDLAKAQYSASFTDSLRVEVSTDCGTSFTTIYEKTGLDLATVGYQTSIWTPSSASQWRNEEIDLTAYEGENVLFKFVNITGYGNSTFIDNINVSAEVLNMEDFSVASFKLFPNPTTNSVRLTMSQSFSSSIVVSIYNSLGQEVQKINAENFTNSNYTDINVAGYGAGLYFVMIKDQNKTITKKLVIR